MAYLSSALAGPGPSSWLYRLSLRAPPSSSRAFNSSSKLFAASQRPRKPPPTPPKRQKAVPLQPPKPHKAAKATRSSDPPRPVSKYPKKLDLPIANVIFLPPPPDYNIAPVLQQLLDALDGGKIDIILPVWSHLIDLDAVSRLKDAHFRQIAQTISKVLTRRTSPDLGRMAIKQPLEYGLFLNMAIEAAARHHIGGLTMFMFRAMERGRPGDVARAYDQTKAKMRLLQGKDEKDLVSWDRQKRLAARLEGPGLRTLTLANVAALTLLDQCDKEALYSMLDADINLRPQSVYNFGPIYRMFRRISKGDKLYDKFRVNLDNLLLAVQCYHPPVFVKRIDAYSHAKSYSGLYSLYDKVLESTEGKGAFIMTRDLDDFTSHMRSARDISLPPVVWLAFMRAFEWHSQPDRIAEMVDTIFPARQLRINSFFLAQAMVHMSVISSRRGLSRSIQAKARAWADEYWRRLTSNGWHMEDQVFSRRVKSLAVLIRKERRLEGEVDNLYDAAKAGHLGKIGPKTRAAFVESFMAGRNLPRALEVFSAFPHDPSSFRPNEWSRNVAEHDFTEATGQFIRFLAMWKWGDNVPMTYCRYILAIIAENKVPIEPRTLGPLLSIQISSGLPIIPTVDAILSALPTRDMPTNAMVRWTEVLAGMLTKWTHVSTPNAKELEAGLYILQRASTEELYGRKRIREYDMWTRYLRPAAKTDQVDNTTRAAFIDAAMDCFPGGYSAMSTFLHFEIIHTLLMRPDRLGFGEGWKRWNSLLADRQVEPEWYDRMLRLLLLTDRTFAPILVKSAFAASAVPADQAFWLRAEDAGLIRELGLGEELEMRRKEMAGWEKGWVDTLVRYGREDGDVVFPEDSRKLQEKEEVGEEAQPDYEVEYEA
ncbi:hypothetical protein L202_01868 [Cryptococcus amylolentus CBS 6039]|uniref:Uncharacterized protein n=1 Tax=Cryptococcus amylolentus CBS 6039 TaxID=1295533 RepID=A0A1E3HYS7_9TREE|nr:hypothetical protein L202_01868 [Cryptococcus amylolentus CBS 6039]ODN81438.1 hypothetical protein L202_01868 [Cryptococcus amylolentus CBS 6039]